MGEPSPDDTRRPTAYRYDTFVAQVFVTETCAPGTSDDNFLVTFGQVSHAQH